MKLEEFSYNKSCEASSPPDTEQPANLLGTAAFVKGSPIAACPRLAKCGRVSALVLLNWTKTAGRQGVHELEDPLRQAVAGCHWLRYGLRQQVHQSQDDTPKISLRCPMISGPPPLPLPRLSPASLGRLGSMHSPSIVACCWRHPQHGSSSKGDMDGTLYPYCAYGYRRPWMVHIVPSAYLGLREVFHFGRLANAGTTTSRQPVSASFWPRSPCICRNQA